MKRIEIKLRKGWTLIPEENISDWAAPVGAIVWGATTEKRSSQSFNVYTYKPVNSGAKEECIASIGDERYCKQYAFGGYNCYGCASVPMRGYDFTIYRHFLEVEDYIVCVVATGTDKQAVSVSKWIEKHMSLGEEIENANGNPLEGGMPLVPPALLAQVVDFTSRDFSIWAASHSLPLSHFDFIVRSSMMPATDPEKLLELVNLSYTQHAGCREIDYNQLSEEAQEIVNKYPDHYIGFAERFENPFGAKVRKVIVKLEQTNYFAVLEKCEYSHLSEQILDKYLLEEDFQCHMGCH